MRHTHEIQLHPINWNSNMRTNKVTVSYWHTYNMSNHEINYFLPSQNKQNRLENNKTSRQSSYKIKRERNDLKSHPK